MGGALRPGRRPSMGGPLADRLREKARDRVAWTELVQLVKTVVAAVVAWILAAEVLDLPQPFLAPWSALLVVHATVYSTFSRGAQQVGATVIGVVVAWGIGNTLGLDPVAIAVLLLVGMVAVSYTHLTLPTIYSV